MSACTSSHVSHLSITPCHSLLRLKAPLAVNVERLATAYAMGDASFPECLEMQQGESSWLHLIPRPYPSGTSAHLSSGAQLGHLIALI